MAARTETDGRFGGDTGSRGTCPAAGRSAMSGATLLYGSKSGRPDLILMMQLLIDDLRAEGNRIGGVTVNAHTLRLRIDDAELALALSAGPLPAQSLRGLRRPAARVRLTQGGASQAEPAGAPAADGAMLTDLGTIRVMRSLQQHQAALGVLLRRREPSEPSDLDATLQLVLQTLTEVSPPSLLLWQRSGLVFTGCEFAAASLDDLTRPGTSAQPLPQPDRFGRRSEREPGWAEPPTNPPAQDRTLQDRAGRAERRSAGKLFRRDRQDEAPDGPKGSSRRNRPATLPRLTTANASIAAALRNPPAPPANLPQPVSRRLGTRMLLGLWFALVLPNWFTLQAMLVP